MCDNEWKIAKMRRKICEQSKNSPCESKMNEQHQVVDMIGIAVEYRGVTYQFIFSLHNSFFRFHWLPPLERIRACLYRTWCT